MNVQERQQLLVKLGEYIQGNDEEWQAVKQKAYLKNQWFIPEFIELSASNIANEFLREEFFIRLLTITISASRKR